MQTYLPRRVIFVQRIATPHRTLKVYTITSHDQLEPPATLDSILNRLADRTTPPTTEEPNNPGFAIVNVSAANIYVVINWWTANNRLKGRIYQFATDSAGDQFIDCTEQDLQADVAELALQWHERNAWIKHVLLDDQRDTTGYLADVYRLDFV